MQEESRPKQLQGEELVQAIMADEDLVQDIVAGMEEIENGDNVFLT